MSRFTKKDAVAMFKREHPDWKRMRTWQRQDAWRSFLDGIAGTGGPSRYEDLEVFESWSLPPFATREPAAVGYSATAYEEWSMNPRPKPVGLGAALGSAVLAGVGVIAGVFGYRARQRARRGV